MPAKTEVDWDAVRREKAAGVSAKDLAEKYGVHVSNIYLHLNGTKPAGGGKSRSTPKVGRRVNLLTTLSSANGGSPSSGLIGGMLARLRQERDRIEKAIAALEAIET